MISVVIPVYNEEESIINLYSELKHVLNQFKQYELIFVDDGSTDQTFEKLLQYTEKDKQLKIVKFQQNFGQSAALACGFDFATGEIVITLDADLQNDPSDIPLMLEKIREGNDLIVGWRKKRKDPLLGKKVPSRIFNWLTSKMSGINLHDFGSPFKAYRKDVAKNISRCLYGELHRYIPVMAAWHGYKVSEVEVKHNPRRHGKTKYGVGRLVRGSLDLFTVYFLNKHILRPIHLFGGIGLTFITLGICTWTSLVILHLTSIGSGFHGLLLLLGALTVGFGVQFIALGLLGEMITKYQIESGTKKCYNIQALVNIEKVESTSKAGRQAE